MTGGKNFPTGLKRERAIQNALLHLVDEDTDAFNKIMEAFALPKKSEEEKQF